MTIAPNGMKILNHLGIGNRIARLGAPIDFIRFTDKTDKAISRFGNKSSKLDEVGAIALPRSTLMQVLREKVSEAGITVLNDFSIDHIDYHHDYVNLYFKNKEMVKADMVIGADGANSTIRQYVCDGQSTPKIHKSVVIGGLVKSENIKSIINYKDDSSRSSINLLLHHDKSFGFCCGSKDESIWMWWCRVDDDISEKISHTLREKKRELLLNAFSGWKSPVQELLLETEYISVNHAYDLEPLHSWHKNRAVLIGDAAHAMPPSSGQGASLAMEDALSLACSLSVNDLCPQIAFEQYASMRKERVEKIAELARRQRQPPVSPLKFWFIKKALSVILPIVGPRSNKWIYDYDPRQISWYKRAI